MKHNSIKNIEELIIFEFDVDERTRLDKEHIVRRKPLVKTIQDTEYECEATKRLIRELRKRMAVQNVIGIIQTAVLLVLVLRLFL